MSYRILHLVTDLNLGGTPRMVETLLKRLDRRRFHVEAATLLAPSVITDSLRDAGIPVIVANMQHKLDIWSLRPLWHRIRDGQFDIIHGWLFHANQVAKAMGTLAGVEHVLTSERGVETNKSTTRVLMDRWGQRFMERLVVNAESIRDVQIRRERIDPKKMRVIPNGIDSDHFRNEPVPTSPPYRIVTIARFDPVKGHEDLLEAVARVAAHRTDVSFSWVGDGPTRKDLESKARSRQLPISFPGAVEDVRSHLLAAHLFVLPSLQEGMPGSILEAMACGRGVVATRVGGVPQMVVDGETGRLVNPGQPESLARILLECLESKTLESMGRAGRMRVQAKFSIEAFVRAHEELYLSLLE